MDTIDFNDFLNSAAFASSVKGKQVALPESREIRPPLFTQQPHFSAPSHQYNLFKQQTAFAPGAFQSALNPQPQHFPLVSDEGFGSGSTFLDTGMDDFMDMPLSATEMEELAFGDFNSQNSFDIDPRVLHNEEEMSPVMGPTPRVYPGIHTQQANLAKAQQEQQIKLELARQQQAAPLPSTEQRSFGDDQHAKQTISNLLDRMRHSSVAESVSSDATTRPAVQSKSRKQEEDMDDDEKLLNSEEGKKLTSKERRQLRNKVSARAFRSRRKEYISQLEDDIAHKVSEAESLKQDNEALIAENKRLTDLTQMLLAHPAFQTFLSDLGASQKQQMLTPVVQSTPQNQQQQQQQQDMQKDVNPHAQMMQLQQQNGVQVGMVLTPEHNVTLPQNNGWMNFNTNAQVFAVTQIPDEPIIDTAALSGKPETPFSFTSSAKNTPVFESVPVPECEQASVPEPQAEEAARKPENPAFELFNLPVVKANRSPVNVCIESPKSQIFLLVEGEATSPAVLSETEKAASLARMTRLHASMDQVCKQLEDLLW